MLKYIITTKLVIFRGKLCKILFLFPITYNWMGNIWYEWSYGNHFVDSIRKHEIRIQHIPFSEQNITREYKMFAGLSSPPIEVLLWFRVRKLKSNKPFFWEIPSMVIIFQNFVGIISRDTQDIRESTLVSIMMTYSLLRLIGDRV